MEKMNIDWQHYHAPNKEAIKEIPSQLDYLFSANDSPENIEYFLYNELAPNIKHQFKIYDIIEPVIEVIEFNILQKGKHQYKNEILNFLGYIFQEFIRDENSILVQPIEYQIAAQKLSSQYSDEFKSYKRFQFFVKNVFPDNIETQTPEVIFYKSALNNNQKTFETLIHLANLQNIREILFACGLMSFKNPNLKIHDLNITTQQDGITNLGFCINGMEFDKELAITSLSTPKQQSFVWGNGYECVLATSAMMIDSLHKDARYQKNTINDIMNGYDTIRKINIDEDFNFPPHKFMLEDLSSILFHEYLGKGMLIDKKMLTEAQLYFYNLMTEEFRTHTYSLLYAGIMPKGMSIESANSIDDIYNCYN
ncbi:hypothetical protein JCM15754A_22420 [Prevotella aurantiaca JCM 15754]|uniref:hypothetical protein n=1 Tax=Prevotella aurantiaca TaxID=596085 RepID=UPI000469070D|nr:hypothetical protein [Prevotella aurantiaca]